MSKLCLAIILALCWTSLFSQMTSDEKNIKKVYITKHVNPHAPVIDAKPDDPTWETIPWETNFIQRAPYEGNPPSQQTAFKILYDDKNLYVFIRAYDTELKNIVRRMSRRDGLEGDWVTIQLDSYHDLQTAFVFAVNATGVKYDKTITEDGNNENTSWDPVWHVKTSVDEKGWNAEMKIPFSQLRFSNSQEPVWGMQVSRRLFRKGERIDWQFIPQDAPGYVSRFGELHGIKNIKHKRQMEITPYVVGKLQQSPIEEGNPFASGRGQKAALGLDGKFGISSDLTLDITINPDFGQVEADPSEVNLTTFETYFQEKRPFFIEGNNIMNYQVTGGGSDYSSDNLFYSRRIGRSPHYCPDTKENEYLNMPVNTTILGAFKLTGKTQNGLSIGILESFTNKEKAEIDFLGQRRSETVEPFSNFFLARLRKDYNKGSTIIGGMLTAVHRGIADADTGLNLLHKAAYTGGFDLFHSWKNKTHSITLNTVFSHVQGSKEAILNTQQSPVHYFQRPDADYVTLNPDRTSLSGFGGTFSLDKFGNGHFDYSFEVTWRSPGLELNDLGYLRGADRIMQWTWLGYRIWKPFAIFRSIAFNLNQWQSWNFGGDKLSFGGNINLNTHFKNYWGVAFGVNTQGEHFSTNELRGGPLLKLPGAWSYWGEIYTDTRKSFVFEVGTSNYLGKNDSEKQFDLWADVTFRPVSNLSVSLESAFSTKKSLLQYVNTMDLQDSQRYIFASLDQKTVSLTVRLEYSITPDLSIQFYGQPFISAGKYIDFKRISNPRADAFENRYNTFNAEQIQYNKDQNTYSIDENMDHHPDYSFDNPNFNFFQFRCNLVVRWEYIPGSTVFLVWSQGRTGIGTSGNFSFGNDFRDLFDVKPDNVFLIKFTYLFNL
ncbi:MAG: hypothetical protein QG657_2384 [Acidobacteriota bacterium]|nr:hypothetical protein [Acidobacteriota bacterium]